MSNSNDDLSVSDRRKQIINLLQQNGEVDVQKLSDRFDISAVSIRKDLAYLEDQKKLIRTRGGAIKQNKLAIEIDLSKREKQNTEQKRRIGKAASKLVHSGEVIILDSGTTTIEIAKNIKGVKNLTVITNALNIAMELGGEENISLIMPGGELNKKSYAFLGSQTENNLSDYYCEKYFMGAYGLDTTSGVYTPSLSEAAVNRKMVGIAQEIILVIDSSKIGKKNLSFIMPIKNIDKVITDDGISDKDKHNFREENVELIIV